LARGTRRPACTQKEREREREREGEGEREGWRGEECARYAGQPPGRGPEVR